MERVKTGIPGLDELMGGGMPRNQLMLLTGTAGTGKTTLCSQFVFQGFKRHQENGVYLTFEEPPEYIKENMKEFGWDFASLEKTGKFSYIKYDPYRSDDVIEILESGIRENEAKRVVIDSVSALGLHIRDPEELRRMIFSLSIMLRRLKCSAIMVSEIPPGSQGLSRYGVEEFVSDSVVVLYYERIQGTFNRLLQVWKLRGSNHSDKLHPYTIGKDGIRVNPMEEGFLRE
ncbi:MAG: AAA family ATPase [Candidatus Aenigmarchaeota archaeon]|nr:AAA family ATPase [Candidatus Aenigmarchaeota archaeon]